MGSVDLSSVSPDEKTLETYANVFRNLDWITGLKALAFLVIGLVVVRVILRLVRKGLKHGKVPESLHAILTALLRIVLDVVVILSAANIIGIPTTSFLTLIGLLGLAVSLAVQGILSNLAGGFILLASHPFQVGDVIETDGNIGVVQKITMLNTLLQSFDGKSIYIPNSQMYTSRVINYNENGKRRLDLSISVSYDCDPADVRASVLRALDMTENVLPDPAPAFVLEEYGDSAIAYTLRLWCKPENFISVKYGLNETLYTVFKEDRIVMTYPHLNVHMVSPAGNGD